MAPDRAEPNEGSRVLSQERNANDERGSCKLEMLYGDYCTFSHRPPKPSLSSAIRSHDAISHISFHGGSQFRRRRFEEINEWHLKLGEGEGGDVRISKFCNKSLFFFHWTSFFFAQSHGAVRGREEKDKCLKICFAYFLTQGAVKIMFVEFVYGWLTQRIPHCNS